MNTFNRVVLVILLLLAMVVCSFVLVLPVPALRTTAFQVNALADFLDNRLLPLALQVMGVLVALIVDLIAVLLIILEVRRPAAKSISIEQATGGQVTLSIASIADQLKTEVGQLPDVLQVKPRVSAKRSGVVVEVDAKIAAEAGVPTKAERIVGTVRRVVEEKMGLKLVRPPKVNIEAVRRMGPAPASEATPFTPPQSSSSGGVAGTESDLS